MFAIKFESRLEMMTGWTIVESVREMDKETFRK